MSTIQWKCKSFDALSARELYAIIQLRNEVFVVEQNCVFQDADNKDQDSYHLMGWQNDQLVAYTRLLPKGVAYPDYASIGRVINAASVRGTGLGKELMERSIAQLFALWGPQSIKIGAQYYLLNFYRSFGFEPVGDIYVEDNIDHIVMLRTFSK